MLRKTVKAIIVIIALWIIGLILDRYSPASTVFHRQFLFSLQLLVIIWLLLTLLLFIFKAGKTWVARFLPVMIVMVVLAFDILFSFWLQNPAKVPGILKSEFKYYYTMYERNVPEYEPCSIYDSTYSYKIIPGLAFTFGNKEYMNSYQVNSESLRDSEGATFGPQIICAGNAYTFGVGVEQNQPYPRLLAGGTGKALLNTGMSGYGTVREMQRVISADTSILEYLVIQYSRYDVHENALFIDKNLTSKITSDSAYRQAVREYRWRKEYFPGKYAITISYDFFKSIFKGLRKKKYYLSGDEAVSARYFLQVVDRFKPGNNAKILVTEVNDYNDMNSGFLSAVDSLLKQPEFSSLNGRLKTVDMSDLLTRDDYYSVDSHLRPSGHLKIAERIGSYILRDSTTNNMP